ncbi:polysaccharide biosynthesis tyrosine autokinase [Prosthecobacter sp.]|uniref:GumC family protein n=1 Tax=Prosthecobacter sp. TaxID=1965333 RepID=UPI001D8073C8|nr:polysaccharide biosynthesis tyrosine autokinase [Prosthecobacter sp.]MCB1275187.1 polysaccharide biosynthesis tyrosine autokinase [Prosthecobacter sp.]
MNESGTELQKHAMDTWQVVKNRLGLISLSFILIFAAAAVLTYIMPRKYRGHVEMTIERITQDINVFDRNRGDSLAFTQEYIKTQFETITKPTTLYPVIEKLELTKRWELPNRQAALSKLRTNLETQSMLRSDFVIIDYYDQDAQLAATIANEIAKSYMAQRNNIETEKKQKALTVLQQQISDQEDLRRQAQLRSQEAKRKAGIVGDWIVGGGSSLNPGSDIRTSEENMQMSREQLLMQSDQDILTLQSEIDQVAKLSADELIAQASGLKLENQNIAMMTSKLQELQVAREGLVNEGRGRMHPQVLSVDSQVTEYKRLILAAAEAHVKGLQNRLDAAKKKRESLQTYNDEAKEEIMNMQSLYNEYKTAKDEVTYLEDLLVKMRSRFFEEKAGIELVKSPATIYSEAEPEGKPSKPNVPLHLALGGVLGLMFGLGLAFFLEYMDTTVKNLDDVERYLGVPVLAVVPKGVGVLHRSSGFNPDAEAYRILRTNIEFNRRSPDANCLSVVSGGAGEGKSTTMVNLAYVCAQGGYNVLLIDADLRRPSLHNHFDVSHATGLTNYLTTDIRLEDVVMRTQVENLFFLPSGLLPADSAGLLNSQRMVDLIAEVKSRFDLVLIDSPPILGVSDASVLANEADMTMIVVQHRKLPRHMLMRVKQSVENVGGKVVGVVLNNVDLRSDAQYQYYTSYYTYYSPTNSPNGDKGGKSRRRKIKTETTAAAIGTGHQAARSDGDDVF